MRAVPTRNIVEFIEMSEGTTPPPVQSGYAAYPRAQFYGSAEKLERLYRAYHGMSYVFLSGVVAYIFLFVTLFGFSSDGNMAVGVIGAILCIAAIVRMFYLSIRSCKDVGYGADWKDSTGLLLGIVMPLVGLIGIIVIQYLAMEEMKRYDPSIRSFFGIRKAALKSKIDELKRLESSSTTLTM